MVVAERISPNRSVRHGGIDCIILHDTGSWSLDGTLAWFGAPESRVSAHYVIDTSGEIVRCVPEAEVAWHAGASVFEGRTGVNACSIGIELVHVAPAPYPEAQEHALIQLVAALVARYRIPLRRVVGHRHVAPGRKVDPDESFAWYRIGLAVAQRVMVMEGVT